MKRALTLAATIIITLSSLLAQSSDKSKYYATRISDPPQIDGVLDDEAWKNGEWAGNFTQHEPYSGRPASQRTEFKILFDDNNIYVAIRAYDTSPDSIVKRLTRRDEADGDMVGIGFDSYHDLRTAFVFGVSAGGVKFDMMMTNNGQNEDDSWNPNYWARTSMNDEGWVAEMKIPFSQLRFEKNSDDVWGLQVYRIIYRDRKSVV